MERRHGYPAARVTAREDAAAVGALAAGESVESTNGTITLGAADAEIIRFSGVPSRIVLSAFVQDALVTLTDRHGRNAQTFRVPAGTPVEAPVRRERVVAREVAAGALLSVVGYFPREVRRAPVEPDQPVPGSS